MPVKVVSNSFLKDAKAIHLILSIFSRSIKIIQMLVSMFSKIMEMYLKKWMFNAQNIYRKSKASFIPLTKLSRSLTP